MKAAAKAAEEERQQMLVSVMKLLIFKLYLSYYHVAIMTLVMCHQHFLRFDISSQLEAELAEKAKKKKKKIKKAKVYPSGIDNVFLKTSGYYI